MGFAEDIAGEDGWHAALAALTWQVDLGATEPVGDIAINRYQLGEPAAIAPAPTARTPLAAEPLAQAIIGNAEAAAVEAAEMAAARAGSLAELCDALAQYPHCDLRRGARSLVFAGGVPGARVLVLGPAPGRDDDLEGRPFAGQAGLLLDRMFAAIGLSRSAESPATGIYLTPVLAWRPPSDRAPDAAEIAMMRPFVARHIALAAPQIVVAMGNSACQMLLDETGVSRVRGRWAEALGLPVLPMFDPLHLMRNPAAKRDAWADLLALQARLQDPTFR